MSYQTLVNLEKYSLEHQPGASIEKARNDLHHHGLAVLPDFLTAAALETTLQHCKPLENEAYHNTLIGNAYLEPVDETLPEDHARRITDSTSLGVIAYDQFSKDHPLLELYHAPEFKNFIELCIDRGPLCYYDCPLGKVNLAVMAEYEKLCWHFDQSDFVVSIPLQHADEGGEYQYVYQIRSADEENYDAVKRLLQGDHSNAKVLNVAPGSLVLFEGRYTIHRVTEVKGSTTRLVALFGFDISPGKSSTPYLRKIRYGREG